MPHCRCRSNHIRHIRLVVAAAGLDPSFSWYPSSRRRARVTGYTPMKLQIRSISGKGVIGNERLILKVLSDIDIGDYILFRAGYRNGSVTTGVRNTLWFPDKRVAKGDLVIVYTKSGRNTERRSDNGSMHHFFYWGLTEAIWNTSDNASVILHAPDWDSCGPDEL